MTQPRVPTMGIQVPLWRKIQGGEVDECERQNDSPAGVNGISGEMRVVRNGLERLPPDTVHGYV